MKAVFENFGRGPLHATAPDSSFVLPDQTQEVAELHYFAWQSCPLAPPGPPANAAGLEACEITGLASTILGLPSITQLLDKTLLYSFIKSTRRTWSVAMPVVIAEDYGEVS